MHAATEVQQIKTRYVSLSPLMDERMRRQWAATEAQTYGWGGLSAVSDATGISRNTIRRGLEELEERKKRPKAAVETRLRREGGGRKCLTEKDPGLLEALHVLVEPTSRGDPQSALRWTCKSTANLAEELTRQSHPVGAWTVGALLRADGYSLQSNRKTKEGSNHPDRNAQFEYINAMVKQLQLRGQPVISVDTKKKELVGQFKNAGREWQPKGEPEKVDVHDFPDPTMGKVIPYGVFDLSKNEGWVSLATGLGLLGNIIWFLLAGVWLAIGHVISAVLCFITIIGIPFGIQHLKLAGIALAPIGKTIVSKEVAAAARQHNAQVFVAGRRAG